MGNRMTVAKPYIIDEYISSDDNDDDDDDYYNYETAYEMETGDQDEDDDDDSKSFQEDKGHHHGDGGQEVKVDAQVVSSLVKEVETLLTFLDKEDYEGAQQAARNLKGGGGEGGVRSSNHDDTDAERKPLLSKKEQPSSQNSNLKRSDRDDIITDNAFNQEETLPLLSLTDDENSQNTENKQDEDWTTSERRLLRQLDRDLTSFEENESRVVSISDNGVEEAQPRRKRKSSLPRLKRGSTLNTNGSDDNSGATTRNRSRSRESSLPRPTASQRQPRSPASGIPRFCYKAPTGTTPASAKSAASLGTAVPSGKAPPSPSLSTSSRGGGGGREVVLEEACSSSSSSCTQATPFSKDSLEEDTVHNGCSKGQRSSGGQKVNGEIDEGQSQMWEVNISELSGRAKRSKKRSGIPSWTQQTKPSPSSHSPLHSHSTSSLSSPPPSPSSSTYTTDSLTQVTVLSSQSQFTQLEDGKHPIKLTTAPAFGRECETRDGSGNDMDRHHRVLDQKRWNCISRPQYKTSCGISSVVSCWNYLFSTRGHGRLPPLSQEEAMTILGFQAPFGNIKFGPFTGNITLMKWFRQLNSYFKVDGRSYVMYKPCGRNRTAGVTSEIALDKLKSGLLDRGTAFIYHCHNHYCCPVGFEDSPLHCVEAYVDKLPPESIEKTWVFIGDTSRKYGPFHCKSWDEIDLDLNCESPEYFNIRQSWMGIQKRKTTNTNKKGGNLHCIMCFQSSSASMTTTMTKMDNYNNQAANQHSPRSPIIPPPRPFHLHPPPPPSPNSSLDEDQELERDRDRDGGSGDYGGEHENDKMDVVSSHHDLFRLEDGCGGGGVKMEGEWEMEEDEEEEDLDSVSSEDLDEDDSSNYDADSLS